jgi:hypothetical protein
VLLVTRLDRLARSTRDLLNVLDAWGGGEVVRIKFSLDHIEKYEHN